MLHEGGLKTVSFEVTVEEVDGVELCAEAEQVKHCRATRTKGPDDGRVG